MQLGGLGLAGAFRRLQKKKKKCQRCGLLYDYNLDECSHCSHLDENGLKELIEDHQEELEANASLGYLFFFLAILILGLLFVISY